MNCLKQKNSNNVLYVLLHVEEKGLTVVERERKQKYTVARPLHCCNAPETRGLK